MFCSVTVAAQEYAFCSKLCSTQTFWGSFLQESAPPGIELLAQQLLCLHWVACAGALQHSCWHCAAPFPIVLIYIIYCYIYNILAQCVHCLVFSPRPNAHWALRPAHCAPFPVSHFSVQTFSTEDNATHLSQSQSTELYSSQRQWTAHCSTDPLLSSLNLAPSSSLLVLCIKTHSILCCIDLRITALRCMLLLTSSTGACKKTPVF